MSIFKTTDSKDETCMVLTSIMDLGVAEDLRQSLLAGLNDNKTVKVMAGDVERITTPCLQVLFAMKNKAAQQDITFLIPEMSEAFQKALKVIGLDDHFINSEQDI